jgi:hypothetical protein
MAFLQHKKMTILSNLGFRALISRLKVYNSRVWKWIRR